ncbi:MAG TPA: cupin domain-containing protein [Candidatus Binatia bacterium]|nr:cupin domain-containing protein [Candidatus Binatia bacterium]
MEFVNLSQKIDEAGKENLRNVRLFGTDNFRSWMLYFEPGDGTPMHFHQSPETFLVIGGKCSVKGLKGDERILEKNDLVFLPAKEYYQLTNVGTDPLVLFGNRSEPFGVRPVRADESAGAPSS